MKGKIWTPDEMRALAAIVVQYEGLDWVPIAIKETGRTIGAFDRMIAQIDGEGVSFADIFAYLDANTPVQGGVLQIARAAAAFRDAPPAPEPEPEVLAEPAQSALFTPDEVAKHLGLLADRILKLDAHLVALTEDIETLANGLRDWRKETIAHYSVLKDKMVYQSGQMTALMRGFGVKVERQDMHPTPTAGD